MQLFPAPLTINEYDGFDENDIFERKSFGVGLEHLFEQVDNPMTVILDAPWGAGKTTFIKMWCGHMRLQGFPVIYFDAFKHDYIDDAFTAIAGEMIAYTQHLNISEKERASLLSKTVHVGTKLGLAAGKALGSALIGRGATEELAEAVGEVAGAVCSEIGEATTDVIHDSISAAFAERVSSRNTERDAFYDFEEQLKLAAKSLASSAKEKAIEKAKERGEEFTLPEGAKRPLLFVIDELDRCKPPYALALLEVIKHFFAQEGIHFLLVTHIKQLEKSVQHAYGIEEQASAYLQKFYHLVLPLPTVDKSNPLSVRYLKYLEKQLSVDDDFKCVQTLIKVIKCYDKEMKLTPRELERVYSQLSLVALNTPKNFLKEYFVSSTLVLMHIFKPELLTKALSGSLSFEEVCDFLRVSHTNIMNQTEEPQWGVAMWAWCCEDASFAELYRERFQNINSHFFEYSIESGSGVLRYLVAKVGQCQF